MNKVSSKQLLFIYTGILGVGLCLGLLLAMLIDIHFTESHDTGVAGNPRIGYLLDCNQSERMSWVLQCMDRGQEDPNVVGNCAAASENAFCTAEEITYTRESTSSICTTVEHGVIGCNRIVLGASWTIRGVHAPQIKPKEKPHE